MLVLTEEATNVIRALSDRPELPDQAGLRIGPADGADGLAIAPAVTPRSEDQVIEADGARLFLDPTAADMLDRLILDAKVSEDGSVKFSLAAQ